MLYIFELPDEDQAYQVFRTLNSTGQELNQAELIKSHLVKASSDNNSDVVRRWSDMFANTKKPRRANFLFTTVPL